MALSRKRLLAIDDDQASLYILEKELAPDYELRTARDWIEGIPLVMNEHFDGIILDLKMPMFHPEVFIEKLRRDQPNLRSVVLSAYPELLERMPQGSVDAVLTKSRVNQDLRSAIATALATPPRPALS